MLDNLHTSIHIFIPNQLQIEITQTTHKHTVVTSGPDKIHAESLAVEIRDHFSSCLPNIQYEVKAFLLPAERGFGQQLERKKAGTSMGGSSHWNSDSGADMIRFYLPEIFPDVNRLLYLDNDIIVGCCIEEVWSTEIPEGKAVGIALDDLKWATTTQFQRHYNASHPSVYQSIRRSISQENTNTQPLSEDEFVKALPRYPNDGVLLIDVVKYTRYGILANAEEVAMNNNKDGVYVVGLGTQQFTVLSMHDRSTIFLHANKSNQLCLFEPIYIDNSFFLTIL